MIKNIRPPPAAAGAGCALGGGYFPLLFRARAGCGRGAVAFGSAVHSSKREHECRSDLVRRDAFLPNGAPSRRFGGVTLTLLAVECKKAARRRAQGSRRWAAEKAAELTEPA